MGNCCSRRRKPDEKEQTGHPVEEEQRGYSDEMVVSAPASSNTFGNSPAPPALLCNEKPAVELPTQNHSWESIQNKPTIKNDEFLESEKNSDLENIDMEIPEHSENITAVAKDGGIIQLGEESSVTFEGNHRFPQTSKSQTDIQNTSKGLNVTATGHGGPGIVQLGKGSKVAYIAKQESKPTNPEFKGFRTTPLNELRKSNDDTGDVEYIKMVAEFAESVGRIHTPTSSGTGFRVGEKCIMTAYHVVGSCLGNPQTTFGSANRIQTCYIDFDYKENEEGSQTMRFRFNKVIYLESKLDVVVLELSSDGRRLPKPVCFCDIQTDQKFTFIGHNKGQNKQYDPHCTIVDPTEDEIRKGTAFCIQNGFSSSGYDGLRDPNFVRFHCRFNKGASGSPGIVCQDKRPLVILMLLKGYPAFYWDLNPDQKNMFHDQHLLEEGVSMERVLYAMRETNPEVCKIVFPQLK